MYRRTDIARSIRRYLSLMWGEDSGWTLRVERRMVKDDERPVGVVQVGEGKVSRARTSVNQGNVEELFPVTVYAYPPVGDDERVANAAADDVADELRDWIALGLVPEEGEEAPWEEKAAPFRIPLWDYADVPLTGDGRAGPDEPHAAIWVDPESLGVQNLEDPEDGKRRTVALEMRVSVERPGRIGKTGAVSGLSGGFAESPSP